MIKRMNSRSSFTSNDKSTYKKSQSDPEQLCKQLELTLTETSKLLPYQQFQKISFQLIKQLIRRAETENPHCQSIFISTISNCIDLYGSSIELNVRKILLQILFGLNSNIMDEIQNKLQKVKYIVIHTPLQFLLSKAFLLEVRYQVEQGDEVGAIKTLKKCIELNQAHLIEYLQQSQEIRQEIVDHVILAHYQHFKLKKIKQPLVALQNLSKAANAARKSYGADNHIVQCLQSLYSHQDHLMNNMDKYSVKSRAITQIYQAQLKKHYRTSVFYSWQNEKIIAQLIRTKNGQHHILSETFYDIKLDIAKIKQLKNGNWVCLNNGQISINEDQLLKLLGVVNMEQVEPIKSMTTRIEMRNVSRDAVIKKEQLSSSSEDNENLLERQQFKFLKFKTHSRAQSSKKYKQTQ